jgi:hypothetical protein
VYEHTTKSLVGKIKKIKIYFVGCLRKALSKACSAECPTGALGKVYFKNIKAIFVECLSVRTRQRCLC